MKKMIVSIPELQTDIKIEWVDEELPTAGDVLCVTYFLEENSYEELNRKMVKIEKYTDIPIGGFLDLFPPLVKTCTYNTKRQAYEITCQLNY
ncbi:hypothetical protein [Parabacteroides pacaensis]|uniref:hypothetical protein n=1 Tax=Parabacteroides pacaensis TaxID=2086575 RepID=UPI000D10303D|nr:hypothetical protein [Parabacteroides pacaensis]